MLGKKYQRPTLAKETLTNVGHKNPNQHWQKNSLG